jgi:hypothetical protein
MQDAMRSHARTGASVWSPAVCGTGARSQGAREQLPTPHTWRARRAAGWHRRVHPRRRQDHVITSACIIGCINRARLTAEGLPCPADANRYAPTN